MKKLIILIVTVLLLCLGAASADTGFELGQPFMDFTATDTEGNTFSLSEALKDHEAVLVNIWATWCGPCQAEFPDLEKAYQEYKDKVAFIALSYDENDTVEMIEEFRKNYSLTLPMGRDEGSALYNYVAQYGVPTTVVIDRFGNTGFMRLGAFSSADDIGNVLDRFLGDDYKETKTVYGIPKKAATRAYPVSSGRAVYVDNDNMKMANFHIEGIDEPIVAYVVEDDVAHMRFEIDETDDALDMIYYDDAIQDRVDFKDILDPERGAFVYEQKIKGPEGENFVLNLVNNVGGNSTCDPIQFFLIKGEDHIEEAAEYIRSLEYDVKWEFADEKPAEKAAKKAYVLHVKDQDGNPVPGVSVNFCTDAACTMQQSDENGLITFDGAQENYHVQILKAPEGYSFDKDFEMYTGKTYSEWVLHIGNDSLK
ncbi:MAG: redoxin domain-containing protein [Clostridia bacterium]|nr:redoxin domain-containing protein [Clostridia bacterium]